jgi:rhamnosyltransferase
LRVTVYIELKVMLVTRETEIVIAGVVTFNPDLDRLRSNLSSIAPQVDCTVVFDNGSRNVDLIERLIEPMSGVRLHGCPSNRGIAFGLNWLAGAAEAAGARWLVTLDQDSVSPPEMVTRLRRRADDGTGIVTPFIVDRNRMSVSDYEQLVLPPVEYFRQAARRGAITSGSLVDLRVLRKVGAFDDRLFIDYVDYDLNQRVLLAGYRIARVNDTYLLHEVGRAKRTCLWIPRKSVGGRWSLERFFVFGHEPHRCYFKARNRIVFTRKYGRQIGLTHEGAWQIPAQVVLTLLFETEKRAKLREFWRGVWDGFRMPLVDQGDCE